MNTKNNWNDLNWRKIYASVKILQSELVVAYKNKDWVKVHFIQEKLAMSFDARCIAVRKVTVNDGKKTPGFDNIVWNNPIKKISGYKRTSRNLSWKIRFLPIRSNSKSLDSQIHSRRIKAYWYP